MLSRKYKINTISVALVGIVISAIWTILIVRVALYEPARSDLYKLFFPGIFLGGSIAGLLAFIYDGKRSLRLNIAQSVMYFVCSCFDGVGAKMKYKGVFQTICLLMAVEVLFFVAAYQGKKTNLK